MKINISSIDIDRDDGHVILHLDPQSIKGIKGIEPGSYSLEPAGADGTGKKANSEAPRSRRANAYVWYLAHEISRKVRFLTKEEVYRNAIKECGGPYIDFHDLDEKDLENIVTRWQAHGTTGWPCEVVDLEPDGVHLVLRCYFGSSQYTAAEMNRLIEVLEADAEAVGCCLKHETR